MNKESPSKKKARLHADHVASRFPGTPSAWGIAYDSYLEGVASVTSDAVDIQEEKVEEIIHLLKVGLGSRYIAKRLAISYATVRRVQKNFITEEQKRIETASSKMSLM